MTCKKRRSRPEKEFWGKERRAPWRCGGVCFSPVAPSPVAAVLHPPLSSPVVDALRSASVRTGLDAGLPRAAAPASTNRAAAESAPPRPGLGSNNQIDARPWLKVAAPEEERGGAACWGGRKEEGGGDLEGVFGPELRRRGARTGGLGWARGTRGGRGGVRRWRG